MNSISFKSLPADIQDRALDAATAETIDYQQRFGAPRPSCDLDRSSPEAAALIVKAVGGIPGPQGIFKIPGDTFAASMGKLGAWMKQNNVDQITMPAAGQLNTEVFNHPATLVMTAINAALDGRG